jgi:leader peptidase (prepilin peptidase)/N-methyltransferase
MYLIFQTIAFVYGLCIGSFMNVCIYRLPLSRSLVKPGSACPQCGRSIPFYDNIPVVSFLLLRGRCRNCGATIAWRYPLVELLGGLTALATVTRFGLSLPALVYFVFIAVLIVVTFIDIDHRIIPDVITLPGIVLGLAASFLLPRTSLTDALLGILLGGGSLLAVAVVYRLITKKDGMGMGDVKLLAMIGALIGWQGVLFTIFIGSLAGSLIGFILVFAQRRKDLKLAVPFGPFLSLGAILYVFAGPELIFWYYHLMS